MSVKIEKFILDGGRPLIVLPALAEVVGLEEAIILQQLHYLLINKKNGKVIHGKRWIYNTYSGWLEYFPWMTERTLRRYFTRLEKEEKAIESCQPEGRRSRRKYYRLLIGDTAQ